MPNAFTGTLHLTVRASFWQRGLMVLSYGAAGVVCAVMALERAWLLLLLPWIAVMARAGWRRAALVDAASVRRVIWHATGRWAWELKSGAWQAGHCRGAAVFGVWLVILTLQAENGDQHRHRCVLFADSIDHDAHRRLRVRLRTMRPEVAGDARR